MRRLKLGRSLLVAGAMLLAILVAMPYQADALEDKVVIVTSYPKDLTGPFKKAFEAKHPGTTVEVLQKKTSAGVKYIQETAQSNTSDLMWASAPDAFEVLKGDGLLTRYTPKASGIPKNIGSYPINDPDGYYIGFAGSGYGIMWNTRYLKAKKIPVPKEWADLKKPVYHNHVGMSAPSRSGTTHLTVETVIQGEGWDKGWATWKEMAGNFKMVTERSFGVPEGVNSGDFGVGVVIDFFGFSSKATGFPVDFVYPTVTTLVPANVAIVKDAPHPQAGRPGRHRGAELREPPGALDRRRLVSPGPSAPHPPVSARRPPGPARRGRARGGLGAPLLAAPEPLRVDPEPPESSPGPAPQWARS